MGNRRPLVALNLGLLSVALAACGPGYLGRSSSASSNANTISTAAPGAGTAHASAADIATGSATATGMAGGDDSLSGATPTSVKPHPASSDDAVPNGSVPADAAAPTLQTPSSVALAPEDLNFVVSAAQAGLMEVQAGESAKRRSRRADVQVFAAMTVRDHLAANDRLSALATKKGVKLRPSLDSAHQGELAALVDASDAAFDQLYIGEFGVAAHEQAVQLFQRAAAAAMDPDIRGFASQTLPTLRRHLRMARNLSKATA